MNVTLKLKYILLTFFLLELWSCVAKQELNKNLERAKKDIVLISVQGERCEVGELIKLISKSNPKIIGINFLYIEEKSEACDTVLLNALTQSQKVALINGYKEGNAISR